MRHRHRLSRWRRVRVISLPNVMKLSSLFCCLLQLASSSGAEPSRSKAMQQLHRVLPQAVDAALPLAVFAAADERCQYMYYSSVSHFHDTGMPCHVMVAAAAGKRRQAGQGYGPARVVFFLSCCISLHTSSSATQHLHNNTNVVPIAPGSSRRHDGAPRQLACKDGSTMTLLSALPFTNSITAQSRTEHGSCMSLAHHQGCACLTLCRMSIFLGRRTALAALMGVSEPLPGFAGAAQLLQATW